MKYFENFFESGLKYGSIQDSPKKENICEKLEDSCKKILRDLKLKVTTQRILILKFLHSEKHHVTVQSVYESISKIDSNLGFATVYRFLRVLSQRGVVNEVKIGSSSSRYELNFFHHHDHLTCVSCGKINEFENHEIETLQIKVAMSFGYRLTNHVLELYGVCPDCLIKSNVKK